MIIWARPSLLPVIVGVLLSLLGEFIRAWGVAYAGSETRTTIRVDASKLVTAGPFSYVRNPLYCGNILLYLGVGVLSNALFPYLQLAAFGYFVLQYILIVREEENYLEEKFGDEYRTYKKHVPRFFPRLIAYKNANKISIDWKSGWHSEARTLQAIALVFVLIIIRWSIR